MKNISELHGPDNLVTQTILRCCEASEIALNHQEKDGGAIFIYTNNTHKIPLSFPLRIGELLDTIQKTVNKNTLPESIPLQSGLFLPHKEIFQNDPKAVSLTEKECDLLLTLWRARPGALSKQKLLEDVWGYQTELETHTLETHIYRLRQKIETDPSAPINLITDKNGYRLMILE